MCERDAGYVRMLEMLWTCVKEMLGISGCCRCFGYVWGSSWVYRDAGDALDMCGGIAGYVGMLEMLWVCVGELLGISGCWRCLW